MDEPAAGNGPLMNTRFSFGKDGLEVSLPDKYACQVVSSHSAPALDDVDGALASALDHPIGCELGAASRTLDEFPGLPAEPEGSGSSR